MKIKNRVLKIGFVIAFFLLFSGVASADVFSEAAKLGANAGAMAYCGDHFADGSDKSKYNLLRLKSLKEYDNLPSDDKLKALVLKKKAEEDGDYLGDKLDKNRCDSIRKLLILKY